MQARQVSVGQLQQVVQREALGKLAELVASCGANQAVQPLPKVGIQGLRVDLLKQRLLVVPVLCVAGQQGALGAHLLAEGVALGFQRGQLGGNVVGRQGREGLVLQLR